MRHNKAQWVVQTNEYSRPWNLFSSTNTKICTAQDKFSLKNEISFCYETSIQNFKIYTIWAAKKN